MKHASYDVKFSRELNDPKWDSFLESNRDAHFQQTSIWARAKAIEGWTPLRIVFCSDGQIVGGFQALLRRTRLGTVGYLSHGPVLAPDAPGLPYAAVQQLRACVQRDGLKALVLQAPDEADIQEQLLVKNGFAPNHLVRVVQATIITSLEGSWAEIQSRIRKSAQVEVRQAERRGIRIREGDERDLETFFRLMQETCKRQNTVPNPPNINVLRALWNAFSGNKRIRLTFAEFEGTPVSAGLCVCFGDRVTLWKKGWSGDHRDKHPNQLVMYEALAWAHQLGFKKFDCAAMNRGTAEAVLNGRTLSPEQMKGRDFFLLGYGGKPVLLPSSFVYIQNSIARALYRLLLFKPSLLTRVTQLARAS